MLKRDYQLFDKKQNKFIQDTFKYPLNHELIFFHRLLNDLVITVDFREFLADLFILSKVKLI